MSDAERIGCAFILVSWPLGTVLYAWSLFWLWAWFVVPLGAPPITALHAYGLSLLLSTMRGTWGPAASAANQKTPDTDERGKIWTRLAVQSLGMPLGSMVVGYGIHALMGTP